MRDIKFRAWDKVLKVMQQNIQDEYDGELSCFGSYLNSEFYEVMQYTGLKDKNGKEIYEGDIIKFKQHVYEGKAKVIFDGGMFLFKEFTPYITYHSYIQISDVEVIGNIYENPGLLKE